MKMQLKSFACIRNGEKFLFSEIYARNGVFAGYRPLGGTIELGETSKDALKREMLEELRADINIEKLLGMTESFFEFEGSRYHEIAFLYGAYFIDKSFYAMTDIPIFDGRPDAVAKWYKLEQVDNLLLPKDLMEILKESYTQLAA